MASNTKRIKHEQKQEGTRKIYNKKSNNNNNKTIANMITIKPTRGEEQDKAREGNNITHNTHTHTHTHTAYIYI